ncbi:hypothetical protein FIBSPDRAFT_871251 [Athelia psychrophila]|uniref:Uncharacterized protein n=1 Tax=Athelia psychrophila TaxID=1759441 RepID=A0A166AF89_9AGAM|nr:hypothetical protein FIBSPDRAFT_871251 [Fibularhizoctonia sp. CBS 109695]
MSVPMASCAAARVLTAGQLLLITRHFLSTRSFGLPVQGYRSSAMKKLGRHASDTLTLHAVSRVKMLAHRVSIPSYMLELQGGSGYEVSVDGNVARDMSVFNKELIVGIWLCEYR